MDLIQQLVTMQDRPVIMPSVLFPVFLLRKLYISLFRGQLYIIKKIDVNFIIKTVQCLRFEVENRKAEIVITQEKVLDLYVIGIHDLWFMVSMRFTIHDSRPSAPCPVLYAVTHFILDRKICLCCYLKIMFF
jgi:hypothetical protein